MSDLRTIEPVPKQGVYDALVLSVHDGDTFTVGLLVPVVCRLNKVQAAELSTPKGKLVADVVNQRISRQIVAVTFHGLEKYGRTLTDLTINGIDLATELLAEGLVVAWNGNGPKPVGDSQPCSQSSPSPPV